MSRPTCSGCKAIIRWITTRSGKGMPVDPDRLIEYLTDEPLASPKRIALVTEDGLTITGYQGSVLTPGASKVEGYVPHWSTCPRAKDFKR